MDQPKIYDIYYRTPDQEQKQRLVGRVMLHDGQLQVLSDYHEYLRGLEGIPAKLAERKFKDLKKSPYFRVVDREELRQGMHPDLVPETEIPLGANGGEPLPVRPPAIFSYEHPVIGRPTTLESKGGELYFEGQKLSQEEAHRIMENIRSGVATIRYKRSMEAAPIAKMEQSLAKIEPGLAAALEQLRGAAAKGHVHPDTVKNLTREIFVDPMVVGIGNRKAYNDFLSRPREGVHVQIDQNDMGTLNKLYSYAHGDQAIKAFGNAMREARDESVGKANGKLFRVGGDEFIGHFPTHEHAATFLRSLRSKLENIPPIAGTHSLSFAAGLGRNPQEADQAQIKAKQAKKAMGYPVGQAKTHVHSLVPGHEGAIPVNEPHPLKAPPAEAREAPVAGVASSSGAGVSGTAV